MSRPSVPTDLIAPSEACKIAHCSVWTLQRLARRGAIRRFARPGMKLSHCLYSRAEILSIAPRPV